jgi:hypothetical protein
VARRQFKACLCSCELKGAFLDVDSTDFHAARLGFVGISELPLSRFAVVFRRMMNISLASSVSQFSGKATFSSLSKAIKSKQ